MSDAEKKTEETTSSSEEATPAAAAPPPKKRSRFNLDHAILLLAFLVFCLSSLFLIDDALFLNYIFPRPNYDLEKIAKVSRYSNDVRRRVAEDVLWLPLRYPDDIFQGDLVFTGQESETEVEFPDGTKLTISPESLVVIQTIDGKAALDLQLGNVSGSLGKGSSGVVLTSGGQKTELKGSDSGGEPAEIALKVDSNGKAAITVLDGEVAVEANGKTETVGKNQEIKVSKEGGLSEIRTFTVELLAPSANAVIWRTGSDQGQRFVWKAKGNPESFILEIARDAEFESPLIRRKVARTSTKLGRLPSGPLFWRVVATAKGQKKKSDSMSPPQRFTVQQNEAPDPVYPSDRQMIELVRLDPPPPPRPDGKPSPVPPGSLSDGDEGKVRLRWNDPVGSKNYRVQLSSSRSFKSVIWEDEVGRPTTETPPLAAGRFFWRVKSEEEGRPQSEWSPIAQFRVTEKFVGIPVKPVEPTPVKEPPLPPELIEKNLRFEVSQGMKRFFVHPLLKLAVLLETHAHAADGPLFRWRPVEDVDRYRLEISKAKDFSDELVVIETDDTDAEWDEPQLGDYRWRVKSIADDGQVSKPSDTGTLKVTAAPPGGKGYEFEVTRDIPLPLVDLEWDENSYADGYEIQLAENEAFKEPMVRKVSDTELRVELPKWKSYFWRMRSLDGDGRPIGRFGDVALVKTPPKPGPSEAELLEQRRIEEEKRRAEQQRLAEQQRQETEQKAALAKVAEEKRLAAQKAAAETERQKLAAAKRAAEQKRIEQQLAQKKRREAAQRRLAQEIEKERKREIREKQRKRDQERIAQERRREKDRVAEKGEKEERVAKREPSSERSKSEASVDELERPDFLKPQKAIVGLGAGFATGNLTQFKDASAAGVTQFPEGSGEGTTFQMVHLDAEYFYLPYLGVGADFLYGNLTLATDGTTSPTVDVPYLDFGFDIRARWNPFNQLSLMAGVGVKRLAQFYLLDDGANTSAVDQSSFSLLQTIIVDWLPFDRSFMIRGRVDFTQGFSDFPGNISITPSIDIRKWFGKFYVGVKAYRQARDLSIEIRVPPANTLIGNAGTVFNQTMFLVMFGVGF
jgi:hypothetical protein